MAYDYDRTKQLYEQLNDAEKQQFASQNQGNKNYESFINQYNSENQGGTVKAPDYENQGEGNYVYNEKTGYYENTSKPTSVTQEEPTKTPVVTPTKQEDVVKEETIVKNYNTLKQEGALAPLSQEYYSQTSQDAQDKIVSNLNGYRQTNPEYFSDYESFKKNFSYDLRNDEQKNTLDTWYKGYTKGMELSSVPVIDLYTQYKDGDISVSDLETLRIANPTKYAELQNQINKGNIIAAYDDDKGQAGFGNSLQEMAYNMMVQTFTNYLNGDSSSGASQFFKEYENKMSDPEMVDLSDRCTEVQEEMENIQSDLDAIKKSVEKEYEGTGASRAKINAIISDRSYDLQLQLRTLNSEYNKYATQYNNRMQQYQNEFNLQLQEYQIHQQERQQQMNELGFAMDLMNFETNDQKAEREWNYWVKQQEYTNGNINSKDYSTRYKAAIKSVQNLLSQYEGIPMERSAEQMAQDILTAIDNGSDLGTELTKINKQIQQKDEYKILYNNTYGTSNSGFGKTFTLGDTEYVIYNDQVYTADEFNKMFGGLGKANYTVVSEDKLMTYSDGRAGTYGSFMAKSQNEDGNYIGQCGKFVNNYLQEIGAGRPFGTEDIKTRESWINSDEGKVGTIAVFDYNHYIDGKNYGHVGIVVSAPDKNGDFWVKDANFDSDGVIQTRKVNLKDVSLKGFIDPTLDQSGRRGTMEITSEGVNGSTTATTVGGISKAYEPTRVGLYDKYINEGAAPTDAKLKAIGGGDLDKGWQIFDAEVADYMAKTGAGTLEKKKNDEVNKLRSELHQTQAYKDYNQMQSFFKKIQGAAETTEPDAYSDMSLIFGYMKMLDPNSIVRESEYATAAEAGSVPTRILNYYNSAVSGKKLTAEQRKEILESSAKLMDGATELYNETLDDYATMINYGGDASNLGKRGTYYTDEYINKYGTNSVEETDEFAKYIDTAVPNTSKNGKRRPFVTNNVTLSNGQSFMR